MSAGRFFLGTLAACLSIVLQSAQAAEAPKKPNVVIILADDLGWTDLACYGSDLYETPHIDRLAKEGVRFSQAYSACTVCSPTRASLLTGKYPARLHVTDWIPGLVPVNPKLLVPDWTKYLPHEEVTLAEVFKANGYVTGSVGKWHLGDEPYYPEHQGFDLNIAGTMKPSPPTYFAPYNIPTLADGPDGEYLTDRMAVEACKFIDENRDKPFFLYMPHFAVHLPVQGKKEIADRYRSKLKGGENHTNAVYAAMVESLDQAVGQVRQKLDELRLTERTIVVFTSDNGGHIPTTSNRPLRFGKASCYEGGTRVPLIVYWPGVTGEGKEYTTPVITPDLYPTVLEMAGLKEQVPAKQYPDGLSLVPILRDRGAINREALFWHYPHYQLYQQGGATPYGAIRAGDWKLIEFYDDFRVELYNLAEDIGEQRNVADQFPERTRELKERLHRWRQDVGAQMPVVNPAYDPTKPQHVPKARQKKKQASDTKS